MVFGFFHGWNCPKYPSKVQILYEIAKTWWICIKFGWRFVKLFICSFVTPEIIAHAPLLEFIVDKDWKWY